MSGDPNGFDYSIPSGEAFGIGKGVSSAFGFDYSLPTGEALLGVSDAAVQGLVYGARPDGYTGQIQIQSLLAT